MGHRRSFRLSVENRSLLFDVDMNALCVDERSGSTITSVPTITSVEQRMRAQGTEPPWCVVKPGEPRRSAWVVLGPER